MGLGSLLSSGASALGGGALDYFSAKSLQDDAQDFSQKVAQNQIRWRVSDMKAAGINPILAVNPGAGAAVPSPSAASSSPGRTATAAAQVAAQNKVLNAQAYNQMQQGVEAGARAGAAQSQDALNQSLTNLNNANLQIVEREAQRAMEYMNWLKTTPEGRKILQLSFMMGNDKPGMLGLGLAGASRASDIPVVGRIVQSIIGKPYEGLGPRR